MPNLDLSVYKKYLLLGIILVFVSILIIFSLFFSNTKSTKITSKTKPTVFPTPTIISAVGNKIDTTIIESTSSAIFTPVQKIAKIGEEIIYGADLSDIINSRYPKSTVIGKTVEEVKKRALNDALEDTILLQEEKKSGGIDLVPPIFDAPEKNYVLRRKIIEEIKNKRLESQEKISGAFISIWYHNVRLPDIPLADAQQLALSKIQKIYDDIKSGKITFETGGQMVKNDTTLAQIDKNYRGNAYYEFNDKISENPVFVYPDLENRLWKLNEGEMSEIIKHPPPPVSLGKEEEEFFGIIYVSKRTNKGNGNYKDWFEKTKQQYEITIY